MKDTVYLSQSMGYKDVIEIGVWVINTIVLFLTIYFVRKSPIDAVKIGRELNDAQLKDAAKRNLFFTLFSYRGSPVNQYFVDALNRIDIVFFDVPPVLDAWRKYFEALGRNDLQNKEEVWRLHRTELLSQMSLSLGYKDIKPFHLEQHYYPEGHGYRDQNDNEFRFFQQEYYKTALELNHLLIELYKNGGALNQTASPEE